MFWVFSSTPTSIGDSFSTTCNIVKYICQIYAKKKINKKKKKKLFVFASLLKFFLI